MPDPSTDPRHRNAKIFAESAASFLDAYGSALHQALATVNRQAVDRAFLLIEKALVSGAKVLVAGNGGSAAITNHLACDWMKGTRVAGEPTLRVHSLVANTSLFTAIANDFGYDHVFSTQLDMYGNRGDICVLISASGNSPNILRALEKAQAIGIRVIGLTGFDGGSLAEHADVSLHVATDNYGLAEDAHQALMHTLAQFLALRQDQRASNHSSSTTV